MDTLLRPCIAHAMNRGPLFHNNELALCQSYLPWLAFCVTRQLRESITLLGGSQAYAVRRWASAADHDTWKESKRQE